MHNRQFLICFLCLSRPGSVIVDFFITSAEAIQISGEINQAIYTNMKELNFKVDQTSIAETGKILDSLEQICKIISDMQKTCCSIAIIFQNKRANA